VVEETVEEQKGVDYWALHGEGEGFSARAGVDRLVF